MPIYGEDAMIIVMTTAEVSVPIYRNINRLWIICKLDFMCLIS